MDHIVYLDAKAREMEKMLNGEKNMIIRGAAGRKMPYGRVHKGDWLYFINNNAEGIIKATGQVINVINSNKLTKDDSHRMVEKFQEKLALTQIQFKRWAGKRYLVLVEVALVQSISPFTIDKSDFGNMDDWLLVEDITRVKT
jgi:hypothetical protein